MDNFKAAAAALGHRVYAIADRDRISADQIASRVVCERIVDEANWHPAFGPAPYMLKGGLLIDNLTRPTADADIQTVRSYSEDELLNGMRTMKDILRPDGIDIVDARVRYIDAGYGDPVSRLEFSARVGGIRVTSQVDISSGFGCDAFPDVADIQRKTFPSFATKNHQFPWYTARSQPLESQLAEKWIAVAMQSSTDSRMRHHADLVLLHSREVDIQKLGGEIMRVLRHRSIHPREFSEGIHRRFKDFEILKRAPEWNKVRAQRPNMREFEVYDVWASLARTYRGGVYDGFVKAREQSDLSQLRRWRDGRRHQRTHAAAIAADHVGDNVIAFRPRGM